MYFTEQPMSATPESAWEPYGYSATLFPNKHFDPVEGSRLYNERLVEYQYAEEAGVDGIMLNEHHNAPFCMQAKINIFASILAAVTKRVKIVLLGNPLPCVDNPVRLAEELSMIGMVSKGRLVAGIVRGAGQEQLATNANPDYNRERFEEAHDLLVKTFTDTGPFRWEGDHYHFRVVNPWAMPLQKPHPRIWVPGVISRESIVWTAQQGYPYIALNPMMEDALRIWEIYDETAESVGYKGGPEYRGYLIRCHVQEDSEKAIENARQHMWMQGEFLGLGANQWQTPSGYSSPESRRQRLEAGRRVAPPFEDRLKNFTIVAGNPDQVIEQLAKIMERARPSILALWANDGYIDHTDSMECIRLLGERVIPSLHKIGDELGLRDPFHLNSPVSIRTGPMEEIAPVPEPNSVVG
jgi:alkanesulfonate monooxygenase SsuD/methylene tetrahydromethanopterin reductase-like flavin-dependent oxidoreductase (luciferase family)